MATIDWPTTRAFTPARMKLGVSVPKAAWAAPWTGQVQSISHLSDRLMCTLTLPPCNPANAALREAFLFSLASTGDWVRMRHWQRPIPLGTLRGSPTVQANAAAGARTLSVQTTSGATMLGGDILGGGGQLILAAYEGATANGSGVMSLPLSVPLRVALSSGAALTWSSPTATWQLATDQIDLDYISRRLQDGVDIPLREVF